MLGQDQKPIGPVSTERLLEGIEERRVPPESLVCVVGGSEWKPVGELPPFTKAFAELDGVPSNPPPGRPKTSPEATLVDPPTIPPPAGKDGPTQKFVLPQFDDTAEKTVVEEAPNWAERQ